LGLGWLLVHAATVIILEIIILNNYKLNCRLLFVACPSPIVD
jgi:hypothetical protein